MIRDSASFIRLWRGGSFQEFHELKLHKVNSKDEIIGHFLKDCCQLYETLIGDTYIWILGRVSKYFSFLPNKAEIYTLYKNKHRKNQKTINVRLSCIHFFRT